VSITKFEEQKQPQETANSRIIVVTNPNAHSTQSGNSEPAAYLGTRVRFNNTTAEENANRGMYQRPRFTDGEDSGYNRNSDHDYSGTVPPVDPTNPRQSSQRRVYTQYPIGVVAAVIVSSVILFMLIIALLVALNGPDGYENSGTPEHRRFMKQIREYKAQGFNLDEYVRRNKGEVYSRQCKEQTLFRVVGSKAYTVLASNDTSGPTHVGVRQFLDLGLVKKDYVYSLQAEENGTEIAYMSRLSDSQRNPFELLINLISTIFNALLDLFSIGLLSGLYIIIAAVVVIEIILIKKLILPSGR